MARGELALVALRAEDDDFRFVGVVGEIAVASFSASLPHSPQRICALLRVLLELHADVCYALLRDPTTHSL